MPVDPRAIRHLRAVRSLLTQPDHWVREVYAKRADGTPTTVSDPLAVRFCLAGAVQRVLGTEYPWGETAVHHLLGEALRRWPDRPDRSPLEVQWYSLETFNNGHTHADVLALVDDALALAEAGVAA